MAVKEILALGNPSLYKACADVRAGELEGVRLLSNDMFDTIAAFRMEHGWGRAIAAPQIGDLRRVICADVSERLAMINPVLEFPHAETMTVWDDCMSFPELLVKVTRRRKCLVRFRDLDWAERTMDLADGMSELLQHEVDHLDGILTIQRTDDDRAIVLRSQRAWVDGASPT